MGRNEFISKWELRTLGDPTLGIHMQPGFACGRKDVVDGVPHLRMNNITSNGLPDFSLIRRVPREIADKTAKWLESGDVMFCNTNSTELVGKCCLFRDWQEPCTFSNHVTRLRPNLERVMPEWLLLTLRRLWLSGHFAASCQEFIGQSAFNLDKLREVRIPVPPLAEQRRIVARIEELMGRLGRARMLHNEASQEVSAMFQSGLKNFFSSENTEDWPAYCTRQLFSAVAGQVSPDDKRYADMLYVGPDSIERGSGRLLRENLRSAKDLGLKSGKYLFGPEHVLYSKIRPALRKVCLPDFAGVCSADMYPLLPNADLISREFLALSLLSPAFSQYVVDNSDRNAMPKINRTVLFSFEMRVPDRDTQRQITNELFGLQVKALKLNELQAEAGAELASFTPALLAKAFRGEL